MSTTRTGVNSQMSTDVDNRVVVRAWGDEPVLLHLHYVANKTCYVGMPNSNRTIGIPCTDAFRYNSVEFSNISTAFAEGRIDEVREMFGRMDDFSCNKYQDKVSSLHEEEPITNSGGVASGS